MGLIATMAALVLSLLIASASTSYDRQSSELKALSSDIILLDRALEFYGTDAKEMRDRLRDDIRRTHDVIWSPEGARPEYLDSKETRNSAKAFAERLQNLSPKTDTERTMQSQAMQAMQSIERSRLLMFEQL